MSSFRAGMLVMGIVAMLTCIGGCDALPGKPQEADRPLRPSQVKDFAQLYGDNCSGCHGADGKFGAAPQLQNPVFLALIADTDLRRTIAQGVPGTAMPPFARSAGGALTDEQIAHKLDDAGIHVTRRTVAKYREDMRIPSTHQRRVKS